MTTQEKMDMFHDMAEAIKEPGFNVPAVDKIYLINHKRYLCVESSQRVNDNNGDIAITAVFKRKHATFNETYGDGIGEA